MCEYKLQIKLVISILVLLCSVFSQQAQARGLLRSFRGQRYNNNQQVSYNSGTSQPNAKESSSGHVVSQRSVSNSAPVSQGQNTRQSKNNWTPDERKAEASRHKQYQNWFGPNYRRSSINPEIASRKAYEESSKQQGYKEVIEVDTQRYRDAREGISQIEVTDTHTGKEVVIYATKDKQGRNVYEVYDRDTGKYGAANTFLSQKGLNVLVGYGNGDTIEWGSQREYKTTLDELNIFASFNRGSDSLIKKAEFVSESPSDLGQSVSYPVKITGLEEFVNARGVKGEVVRPELAISNFPNNREAALAWALAKIETSNIGKLTSVTKEPKLQRILENGRIYEVMGGINAEGRPIFFAYEY